MINKRPSGIFAFTVVWVGQAVPLGTEMSAFALTIQAYELTGKATALGETIAEKSGKDIGSQYLALGDSVDNYEQQFAKQVKAGAG